MLEAGLKDLNNECKKGRITAEEGLEELGKLLYGEGLTELAAVVMVSHVDETVSQARWTDKKEQ